MKTENKYTTLSIPFFVKDQFLKLNSDWNIKNPSKRKTKEEFMMFLINNFKQSIKDSEKKSENN